MLKNHKLKIILHHHPHQEEHKEKMKGKAARIKAFHDKTQKVSFQQ